MCLYPKILSIRNRDYCLCDRTKAIYEAVGETGFRQVICSCGKCVECMRNRQNDLAVRCAREAELRGSMQFLTLTYRDDALPFSMCLERVVKDTGECEIIESCKVITRQQNEVVSPDLPVSVLEALIKLDNKKYRYLYRDLYEDEQFLYRAVLTPSLNPRDLRLWLKSCRVKYEREFHVKLPKFTYVACGELGATTHRPHYHIAFFGLSYQQVSWMASLWSYGYTYLKCVNAVNPDGSSGFEIASRYIGKYISKGNFEAESIRLGYSYKPRLMSSKGLGGTLSKNVVSYFRCYDLFGEYDINKPLSKSQLALIVPEVKKRFRFSVAGRGYRLPNRFIKQIWYVKSSKGSYVSSNVRKQITSALCADLFADPLQRIHENHPEWSLAECNSFFEREEMVQKACVSVKNERGMLAYQKFYLTSKF